MKILVVDDEALIRLSIERVFRARGHDVKSAANGLEGLRLVNEFLPDLLILDVLMPGLTGPELLDQIGAIDRPKVVMISAFTGHEHDLKSKSLGPDQFIKKPFEDIFVFAETCEGLMR